MIDDFLCSPFGAPPAGDMAREAGSVPGGEAPLACFFLCFLREDSVPLASDWFGEPGAGRLREVVSFNGSEVLFRPDGVLLPLEDAPEGSLSESLPSLAAFSFSAAAAFSSSSFFFASASRSRSSSLSVSLYV
jgi:hypothetical protein